MIKRNQNLKKIDALRIINENISEAIDMAAVLANDGIISKNELIELKSKKDRTEYLFILIEKADQDGKLDLLDYEWQVLPVERVTLTIITKNNVHNFTYEQ